MVIRPDHAVCRAAPLGLLLGLMAGCGEDGNRQYLDAGAVVQRDSAGITIIETPGAAARAPIGWTVDELPDLELGSSMGDGPDQFHLVGGIAGGIAGLPDGRILVVDGGSRELRFFDAQGHFLARAGGDGDGPGEFRSPRLLPYVSSDSVLVFDTRHRQFTLFSGDGRAHRGFPVEGLPRELVTGMVIGASESGILMMAALGAIDLVRAEGHQSDTVGARWIDLESRRGEIVAEFQTLSYRSFDLGDIPHLLTVPFSGRPAAAMGPNGFFVTSTDAAEIHEFDMTGRLIRIFRLAEAPRPVTREDIESVIDFEATRFNVPAAQARRVYERMEFPDHWTNFRSIRVDRLGWIWVELYRLPQDDTPRWMLFEPNGVARGTSELPQNLEVHDIGADYILGRSRDALGVEYVHRYRLTRHE